MYERVHSWRAAERGPRAAAACDAAIDILDQCAMLVAFTRRHYWLPGQLAAAKQGRHASDLVNIKDALATAVAATAAAVATRISAGRPILRMLFLLLLLAIRLRQRQGV